MTSRHQLDSPFSVLIIFINVKSILFSSSLSLFSSPFADDHGTLCMLDILLLICRTPPILLSSEAYSLSSHLITEETVQSLSPVITTVIEPVSVISQLFLVQMILDMLSTCCFPLNGYFKNGNQSSRIMKGTLCGLILINFIHFF